MDQGVEMACQGLILPTILQGQADFINLQAYGTR